MLQRLICKVYYFLKGSPLSLEVLLTAAQNTEVII